MAGLPTSFQSIEQLRQFEPNRSYLWDLQFAFNPFRNGSNAALVPGLSGYIPTKVVAWIPADSLSRVVAVVNSADLTCGQTGFRFPSGSTPKEVSINFIDDYKGSVRDWLETWMEGICLCNGNGVNYLDACVDILTIYDLYPTKETRKETRLYVYPDGVLQDQYTSETGIKVYSLNFVVCGKQ